MEVSIIIFVSLFIILIALFTLSQSPYFIMLVRKKFGYSKIVYDIKEQVKGKIDAEGYFSQNQEILTPNAFKNLRMSDQKKYTKCYNILKFKTENSNWELFFYIVKDGFSYSEILTIRAFPQYKIITQEASIERVNGHISIFSSSRFLSEILEEKSTISAFEWIIRTNTDSFLIQNNNLAFKIFCNDKTIQQKKILDYIKVINHIKNKVFKNDNLRL
ncbi:MAG: hypothetical protein LAT82_01105 [Nanoarchaeota archaeon]|nr:hypothetical protein [Nanoarchaeota archaeon]